MCALETIRRELVDMGIQLLSEESTSFFPYNPRGWGTVTTIVAAPKKAIGVVQRFLDLESSLAQFLGVHVALGFRDTGMQYSLLTHVYIDEEDFGCGTRHRRLVCLCLYSKIWPTMPTIHYQSVPSSCLHDPYGLL